MLDFRRSKSRDGRLQRDRQHLFFLVLAIVAAMALLETAWRPETAGWITTLVPSSSSKAGPQIDNRVDDAVGEPVVSAAETAPDGNSKSNAPADTTHTNHTNDTAGDGVLQLSDIAKISFEAVADDTPSSVKERAVSLQLLCILKNTEETVLQSNSVGPVTYAQLFRQPEAYRGKLATVSGVVRRAQRLDIAKNPYGIHAYYQIWLFPKDNSTSPLIIYCLRLPKAFPLGKQIAENVVLTGFFFKRCAYQAKDAVRTTPTLLAKTLHWQRPSAASELSWSPYSVLYVVGCAILLTAISLGYVHWRSHSAESPNAAEERPQFENLYEASRDREGD